MPKVDDDEVEIVGPPTVIGFLNKRSTAARRCIRSIIITPPIMTPTLISVVNLNPVEIVASLTQAWTRLKNAKEFCNWLVVWSAVAQSEGVHKQCIVRTAEHPDNVEHLLLTAPPNVAPLIHEHFALARKRQKPEEVPICHITDLTGTTTPSPSRVSIVDQASMPATNLIREFEEEDEMNRKSMQSFVGQGNGNKPSSSRYRGSPRVARVTPNSYKEHEEEEFERKPV